MIRLKIDDRQVQADAAVARQSQNPEPANAAMAARMLAAVEDNFHAEGRPDKVGRATSIDPGRSGCCRRVRHEFCRPLAIWRGRLRRFIPGSSLASAPTCHMLPQ